MHLMKDNNRTMSYPVCSIQFFSFLVQFLEEPNQINNITLTITIQITVSVYARSVYTAT